MGKDERDPTDALARTRAVLTRAAAATGAFVAFLATVAAFNFDEATREVRFPVWIVVIAAIALAGVVASYVIYMYFENKRMWDDVSYWRSEARNLADFVSNLEDLAYYDPITGLPNSNALKRELSSGAHDNHCLILMDLRDFGAVNKKHSHWKGDEYLRTFSSMISGDSRRNEHIYKDRPINSGSRGSNSGSASGAVKAFRRNAGGDEFYILLRGTVIDGLGYLNRLHSRAKAFDEMAIRVLDSPHPFGFRAGLIALGKDESFESATERVSMCLARTTAVGSESLVDWGRIQGDDRTPVAFDDERFHPGSIEGNILAAAKRNFTTDSA
ncbi:MAG TPA: GGDEF domain-containing protein [Jiangellaceae bacterium]